MNQQLRIDALHSGLPRFLIETAFVIMVLAAICSYSPVNNWLLSHASLLLGVMNTAGMVVMYYALLRGMRELAHPLAVLWWIAIGLNLLDFVLLCLGEAARGISAACAAALPLIYLPLGILLMVWYRGRLGQVGLWMIIRILVVNLVPVLFYAAGLFDFQWGLIAMEIVTIAADLWYAWTLRRVLVSKTLPNQ